MAEYRTSFVVAAPPSEVFAYVADLTNLAEWDSSVRSVELASDTGPALGRTFDVELGFYGKELDAVYEIVEFEPGAIVGWSIGGRASGSARVGVRSVTDGTEVDYQLVVTMPGIARLLDRGLKVALEGIGENAERGLTKRFR